MALEIDGHGKELSRLIDTDQELEVVADGFTFTEGPVWMDDGLVFSDIPGDQMWWWSPDRGIRSYRRPSNKANGNTRDNHGRLVTCEHSTSRVVRELDGGMLDVIADRFDLLELNSPNDVVVTSDGSIWFTDPPFGRLAMFGVEREPQLDFSGVYRIAPSGEIALVTRQLRFPNGLCFSRDERALFVNDTVSKEIWAFDVGDDWAIGPGRLWATTPGDEPGAPDGMKIDEQGNLWCTGPGGLQVFDANADWIGTVRVEGVVGNFAWGGVSGHDLFVCASSRLGRLQTRVTG